MSFDTLAPHYRWIELVAAGDKLQRCRTALLHRVMGADQILILGEGNGRFLAECRRKLPKAKILCVDASARMIALARARLAKQGDNGEGLDFVCADALEWMPPEHSFNLIVTHFFLDCFQPAQVERLVAKLADAATPEANWLLADFQTAPAGLRRHRSRLILWSLYRFFRVATRLPARTLTSPAPSLERHGFVLHERENYDWELLYSGWWKRRAS